MHRTSNKVREVNRANKVFKKFGKKFNYMKSLVKLSSKIVIKIV